MVKLVVYYEDLNFEAITQEEGYTVTFNTAL